jgi:hypothetical protein
MLVWTICLCHNFRCFGEHPTSVRGESKAIILFVREKLIVYCSSQHLCGIYAWIHRPLLNFSPKKSSNTLGTTLNPKFRVPKNMGQATLKDHQEGSLHSSKASRIMNVSSNPPNICSKVNSRASCVGCCFPSQQQENSNC